MGAKPFLTIQEQVDLLHARGMKVDEKTPEVLMREGYYSMSMDTRTPSSTPSEPPKRERTAMSRVPSFQTSALSIRSTAS